MLCTTNPTSLLRDVSGLCSVRFLPLSGVKHHKLQNTDIQHGIMNEQEGIFMEVNSNCTPFY